ncbi:extracellular solute-binding protein [Cyanobacterium aponinum AL20118]|uniref:Extracellular solute-binding protein n=1 Tax=Cyanobacterium aponinum AL20115 TaxID=3090662 RepID=A0AAF0ZBY0_9CHRO|nr:extracellular solute-binding protein [Cyanobacterium aponinum]PHV64379.1 Mg-chelatase subunit ChlD [Cyanobacterium aponinum IPPAS B-1201]WPF88154.1 extracellular solute-binding protein [Cyanobacterium aponinum AL20115]
MGSKFRLILTFIFISFSLLSGCSDNSSVDGNTNQRRSQLEIKFLAGSDLGEFCRQIAEKLNETNPKLDNGKQFYLTCDAKGSGDVIGEVVNLTQQLANNAISADDAQFPSIISVDGEIYQNQLIYQVDKIFPGENLIPPITDTPLIVFSPMVFMTTKELAPVLEKLPNIYTALTQYDNYQQLDSQAPPLPIYFVQTAPIRSNSGLQTLVAQFASVSNKQPQDLTIDDITKYQDKVKAIQEKVTRYGASTASLANSMVENGVFWASVGSVYESLVIQANSQPNASQTQYQAVYPKATFSSNIRGIIPNAPWMSAEEKEGAQKVLDFMLTPESQQLAASLGLRPGIPSISLGNKFSSQYGVNPNPNYESYRPPAPEVVEAMLTNWQDYSKKPSQVAVVVDISGSMRGQKITAVQNTLLNYINNLGSKEEIAIITFSDQINPPVIIKGTPEGKNQGIQYISSLQARGGTKLYDSALYARDWLRQNLKPNSINAVLILTDGEDSGSGINLQQLEQELQKSGFNSDERIAFFTVGYGNDGEFNAQALEEIAKINAGYYRKGDPNTIDLVMKNLQLEF